MTGAGSPGGPGIIQALKKNPKINLHIADANPNASGRYMSTDCTFHQLPMANSKNFIATLLDLCDKKKIYVLLPLVTKELFKLSVHKKRFLEKQKNRPTHISYLISHIFHKFYIFIS